jgi:predicted TIM-barrel fold metal-dependent hydrolase
VASLFRDAGLTGLIMDASYPPDAADRIASYAALSGCLVYPTRRIDSEVDAAIGAGAFAEEVWQAVLEAMLESAPRVVGFKSIVAYRTGLSVDPQADAAAANQSLKEPLSLRRRGKACRDWVLRKALGIAAELNKPFQIHTGLGDSDLRLAEADPLLLEPLLATPEAAAGRIVLIHASYPWHESLAFLASAHDNIWADLSMVNLYSPVTFASRLMRLVELAPPNRLMLGTDGHAEPELFWFGAQVLKDAWAAAEVRLRSEGVARRWIELTRHSLFEGNARDVYGL